MKESMSVFPKLESAGDVLKSEGMTLRDYFAGQVLIGWVTNGNLQLDGEEITAKECYSIADAMLKERGK